jgi:hypothetical protein
MSEVISFRLDKSNKREADAFEILEAWGSKGYSVRHVITEALLKLGDPGLESSQNPANPDLNIVLTKVNILLDQIENRGLPPIRKPEEDNVPSSLADSFVSSVKMAVKPGMRIGHEEE